MVTTVGRFGLQLIAQVILARLLGPDNYGVFGIGLVVFTFTNFFATFGFSWSLMQLKEIDDEDIRFAFTWQMLVGIAAGLILFACAAPLSRYFHEPRVLPVIQWMSLTCAINAGGAVTGALLRRRMDFRANGLIQMGSYFAGYICVGVPVAMAGYGVSALIGAWMVQALVVWIAGYVVAPHSMRPLWWCAKAREIFRIGGVVFLTNIGNWLVSNLDRIMIGRLLNAHSMGVYTAGYNLANMPNTLLIGALQPVFMAAGARVQDQQEKLSQGYQQVMAATWVLTLPAFVFLAAISPDVIALLYGPAWSDAGPVLAILFLAMPAYVMWGMSTPILWNTGRSHHEFMLQLPLLPVAALAFYLFAGKSVLAAAVVASLVMVARGAIMGSQAFRILKLSARPLGGWIARGALLSLIVAAATAAARYGVRGQVPIIRLVAETTAGALAGGVTILAKPDILGWHAKAMVLRFAPSLGRRLAGAAP